jgi:hypothetical protein
MKPFWQCSATDLARAIAGRECSAREVVDAHLARIEQVNPEVNAVVRVMHEEARAAAERADEALGRGETVGPLHGVPFTIKENIDVAGLPTTWGVPALSGATVPKDAPVVRGCGQPARSRSPAPTCPTWDCAWRRRAPCTASPAIHGTRSERPAAPVAARAPRSRPE